MNKRLAIIALFLGILTFEYWTINITFNYAYQQGRKDGIGEMVDTIDSILVKRSKLTSSETE